MASAGGINYIAEANDQLQLGGGARPPRLEMLGPEEV